MQRLLMVIAVSCNLFAAAQTTNIYTSATTWVVPANVHSISVKMYGAAGGTGGQDCGAGCTNPAAGNVGYVIASYVVSPGNVVGIYPGGQAVNGGNSVTNSGGGTGGVASYVGVSYNGGKGGNAGATGSSGGGGGGGAASVLTITAAIKMVAGGAGGGGGMANLAASGNSGTNTYTANGTSNAGGAGTQPAGDGGGGGGGGGGSFGSTGGGTHTAGAEQAGNGGNLGGNSVVGASTTTTNSSIAWTSGGRIEITFSATLPVVWLDFTAMKQNNGSILLNWSTASETNTSSYGIQRSTNGADYESIGSVAAAGNSDSKKEYQYLDKTVVQNTYYYRLAQIDLDGKMVYSKVVVCTAAGTTVRLYPNPVVDHRIHLVLKESVMVVLYNSRGETLLTRKLPSGDNKIDLRNYPAGVYFITAGTEKISFIIK